LHFTFELNRTSDASDSATEWSKLEAIDSRGVHFANFWAPVGSEFARVSIVSRKKSTVSEFSSPEEIEVRISIGERSSAHLAKSLAAARDSSSANRGNYRTVVVAISLFALLLVVCVVFVLVAWLQTVSTLQEAKELVSKAPPAENYAELERLLWRARSAPLIMHEAYDGTNAGLHADPAGPLGVIALAYSTLWPPVFSGLDPEKENVQLQPLLNPIVSAWLVLYDEPNSTSGAYDAAVIMALSNDEALSARAAEAQPFVDLPAAESGSNWGLVLQHVDKLNTNPTQASTIFIWDQAALKLSDPITTNLTFNKDIFDELKDLRLRAAKFAWHGPHVLDFASGPLFGGSVLIWDSTGKVKGHLLAFMSIVDSFSKALEAIVARSVSYGEMGSGAIYTKSGVIFSNTDHPGVFNGVDEMPHGLLRDALKKAYDAAGVYCPKANLDLEDDEEDEHGHRGHKVNVRRFEAQKHGLPPLPEGWCIIIERHHLVLDVQVGEAINSIQNFGIVAAAGLLIATMLIAVKLFYVLRSAKRMQREMQILQNVQVFKAEQQLQTLTHPMVLIRASTLLQMDSLEPHETLRDRGGVLVTVDTRAALTEFRRTHMIIFLSHQWLAKDVPDPDGTQLLAMKIALKQLFTEEVELDDCYVWLDYVSIAQKHETLKQLAIASLPIYARRTSLS